MILIAEKDSLDFRQVAENRANLSGPHCQYCYLKMHESFLSITISYQDSSIIYGTEASVQDMSIKKYSFENNMYYMYDHCLIRYPGLKKGCKSKNDFLQRYDIDDSRIFYAKMVDGEWKIVVDNISQKDKMFIMKEDILDIVKKSPDPLPDTIDLEDHEMFHDADGNTLYVNVVGERKYGACYFSVKDLMKAFDMKYLDKVILDPKKSYIENVHYKIFSSQKTFSTFSTIGGKSRESLYLTYHGLIHMTTTSRSKNLQPYLIWILETLCTIQLGTIEDKRQLVSKVTGMSIQDVKSMCSASANVISCLYLFELGSVKDMKGELTILEDMNDSDVLYKWGRTEDLARRSYEHARMYGLHIKLIYKGFIDEKYLVEAEAEIRSFFSNKKYKTSIKGHNEISIIAKKDMKDVKKFYDAVSEKYVGRVSNMIEELKDVAKDHELALTKKDVEIMAAKKDAEVAKKDAEVAKKDAEVAKKDAELAKKDIEILQMQLKMMELSGSKKKKYSN